MEVLQAAAQVVIPQLIIIAQVVAPVKPLILAMTSFVEAQGTNGIKIYRSACVTLNVRRSKSQKPVPTVGSLTSDPALGNVSRGAHTRRTARGMV